MGFSECNLLCFMVMGEKAGRGGVENANRARG